MSNYRNITRASKYKRKRSTFTPSKQHGKVINSPALLRGRIDTTATHQIIIGGRKLREALKILRSSGLRHYATAFLKGGLQACVVINPFSVAEQVALQTIKSFIADG